MSVYYTKALNNMHALKLLNYVAILNQIQNCHGMLFHILEIHISKLLLDQKIASFSLQKYLHKYDGT